MDFKEDSVQLAKFVCQLSIKRKQTESNPRFHYVRLIIAYFIPISLYPYVGARRGGGTLVCGHTGTCRPSGSTF